MKATIAGLAWLLALAPAIAATTINVTNSYVFGANLGWINWRGDISSGAVIGEYVCSGFIYAANTGWIDLGNGSPTNGVHYQNLSISDFGVNQDGQGNLRGYAWGADIGWIAFENLGAPKVDLNTGIMSGYIYSANCGWITASNFSAFVQTDSISPGQLDANGLPIAWELQNFSATGIDPNADPDHDGMSNQQEYLAGTNPNDSTDKLVATSVTAAPDGSSVTLAWKSVPNREYFIQKTSSLALGSWIDSGLGLIPSGGSITTRTFVDSAAPDRFYRIQVVRPLSQ